MNRWLLRAPWWALAIGLGLIVGVLLGAWMRLGQHVAWPVVMVQSAVFLLVCGPVMGLVVRRQFDRQLEAMGDVPDEARQRVASRPTGFGSIPRNPAERAATVRLIEHQMATLRRKRPRTVVAGTLLAAVMVWLALTRSPWWWIGVAFWGLLLVLSLAAPRLLRRRAELLARAGE